MYCYKDKSKKIVKKNSEAEKVIQRVANTTLHTGIEEIGRSGDFSGFSRKSGEKNKSIPGAFPQVSTAFSGFQSGYVYDVYNKDEYQEWSDNMEELKQRQPSRRSGKRSGQGQPISFETVPKPEILRRECSRTAKTSFPAGETWKQKEQMRFPTHCAEPNAFINALESLASRKGSFPLDLDKFEFDQTVEDGRSLNTCAVCQQWISGLKLDQNIKTALNSDWGYNGDSTQNAPAIAGNQNPPDGSRSQSQKRSKGKGQNRPKYQVFMYL